MVDQSDIDERFMAACLRLALRHRSLTASNPSVGTLLVQGDIIVGKGITAKGGRPHAERIAIDQAGEKAKGATAYVSLEPCAHHGATPPCAQALIDAGVARVVTAWVDPDSRVDGKGHQMLRDAGIEVEVGVLAQDAARDLSGYLNRKENNRPQVTLKLAVSADGKLGKVGQEISITGPLSRAYVHRMRAECEAILVGRGTVEADDPELTCRLSGLEARSPHRFVLDTNASLPVSSHLAQSAKTIPVTLITEQTELSSELVSLGVRHFIAESHDGKLALPEIVEDMASAGISSLMVEGGGKVAESFLAENLVTEIALFESPAVIGSNGIPSPVTRSNMPPEFSLVRSLKLGDDTLSIYKRR